MKSKILFLCAMMLWALSGLYAQNRELIFSESVGPIGTSGGSYALSQNPNWENKQVSYSGSGIVKWANSHQCTLSGSSGKAYVELPNKGDIVIDGIDISECTDLQLQFHNKLENGAGNKIYFSAWIDGKQVITKSVLKNDLDNAKWQLIKRGITFTGQKLKIQLIASDAYKLYLDDLKLFAVRSVAQKPSAPAFSLKEGKYTEAQHLTLTAVAGAKIYYTLDGSVPSESSLVYQEPIVLDKTTTVKAIAVTSGGVSDVAVATYTIEIMPTVSSLTDFRKAQNRVCLKLTDATVVDVDEQGAFVQFADGGLFLPLSALPQNVKRGSVLLGYFVGMPKVLSSGVLSVAEGADYTSVGVSSSVVMPQPKLSALSEVVTAPQSYLACMIRLENVTYQADKQAIVSVDASTGEALRVVTAQWSQDPSWKWPQRAALQGVLKADNAGIYLWVPEQEWVYDMDVQAEPKPAGTTLVLTDATGALRAVQAVIYETKKGLYSNVVTQVNGKVVVPSSLTDKLKWQIDTVKAGLYLKDARGYYLHAAMSGTALDFVSTREDDYVYWERSADGSFHNKKTPERALHYDVGEAVKNYATSSQYGTKAKSSLFYEGYVRTLTNGNWGTVCVPYAVASSNYAGATFYTIKGKTVDKATGKATAIVLSEPVAHLQAGVPYIIKAQAGQLALLYHGDAITSTVSMNGLHGSFTAINGNKDAADATLKGMYVLSDNKLRLCGAGASMGANKAYVDLSEVPEWTTSVPSSLLCLPLAAETTSIIPATQVDEAEQSVYTLQGIYIGKWQQVKGSLPNGVYVVNGVKLVINK